MAVGEAENELYSSPQSTTGALGMYEFKAEY